MSEFTDRYPHGVLVEQEGGVPNDVYNWETARHVCRKHRVIETRCVDAAPDAGIEEARGMRHDLLAHIEAGAFGLPASGCVACYPGGGDGCSTPGCPGDPRYAPPGRRHMDGCRHLLPPEQP